MPPRKLSLSYQGTQHVPTTYIESVNQQWRKSAPLSCVPAIASFYGARSHAHARKTIPLVPIHSFTRQIVPSGIVSRIVNPELI